MAPVVFCSESQIWHCVIDSHFAAACPPSLWSHIKAMFIFWLSPRRCALNLTPVVGASSQTYIHRGRKKTDLKLNLVMKRLLIFCLPQRKLR